LYPSPVIAANETNKHFTIVATLNCAMHWHLANSTFGLLADWKNADHGDYAKEE
jgi:hypothetical protein